jgi:predicted aconitase
MDRIALSKKLKEVQELIFLGEPFKAMEEIENILVELDGTHVPKD